VKIGAHTPRIDVVAAAKAAREAQADALLTVGGGSVTDAAKMVGVCAWGMT
jgi:maleylacetate reductase